MIHVRCCCMSTKRSIRCFAHTSLSHPGSTSAGAGPPVPAPFFKLRSMRLATSRGWCCLSRADILSHRNFTRVTAKAAKSAIIVLAITPAFWDNSGTSAGQSGWQLCSACWRGEKKANECAAPRWGSARVAEKEDSSAALYHPAGVRCTHSSSRRVSESLYVLRSVAYCMRAASRAKGAQARLPALHCWLQQIATAHCQLNRNAARPPTASTPEPPSE
mmetsp:Transcript_7276/g.15918  ORF Transcript_7276/g.15918 Transcript_7276/m.15918 type:complete len:218 (+) Transcript_7276:513-1166(+)